LISVTDGVQSTPPSTASVVFTDAPVIQQITLNITQGETITLTPALLNVTATDGSTPDQVILTISDLEHAAIQSNVTGAPVSHFTLADLQEGEIRLTQDGSPITPSLTVTAEGIKKLSSAPTPVSVYLSNQGVYAPRLVNNYLLVVQGQATVLTTRYLSAENPNGLLPDNSTIFYISDTSHGHFSLIPQPQTWISFFDQGQLNDGQVQFVHDGSLSVPGYRSAVLAFGLQSASLPAAVIFRPVNQPPQLVYSLADQTATVGEPFTYAIPADSFVDPEGEALTFTASRYNSSAPLPDWLYFSSKNNRFTGTPMLKDFIQVNVTTQDPAGLATSTDLTINVGVTPSPNSLSTWEKTVIGALISGGIGIGFALVQICLKRVANKKLQQVLGQGDTKYEQDVVRPVMKEIAQRIKITRFMNATTNKELMAFKSAVRSLLSVLSEKGVNLNFAEMKDTERDKTINEIGNQTYRWMKANQRGCAARCPGFHAFFKPQLKAEELQDAAEAIADQVVLALQKRAQSQPIMSKNLSISDSPVYKDSKRKSSVDLSLPDAPASPS
ncbi:MAG: hypothetical protein JSR33_11395, partial [Proteobacteria bacterium]|nr:hypothetical protein [Pseudomonadota bacterium]